MKHIKYLVLFTALFSSITHAKVTFYSYPGFSDFLKEINLNGGSSYSPRYIFQLDIRDYEPTCNQELCVNDNIDSVAVDSGECVILGRDSYFFNEWVVLDQQDTANLGWFKNRATSFAVFNGPCNLNNRIMFYRNPNGTSDKFPAFIVEAHYTGLPYPDEFALSGLPEVGKFDNRFSSVYLPPNSKVCLYEHKNYQGQKLTLTTSSTGQMFNLTNYGFDDKISSYIIPTFMNCV